MGKSQSHFAVVCFYRIQILTCFIYIPDMQSIFQLIQISLLASKIHNYVKQNITVNFIIQKLKNKHFPQKVYKLSSVFIFQFFHYKIYNYVKQNITVNFIIQKFTIMAKKIILTEQKETKTRYFAPQPSLGSPRVTILSASSLRTLVHCETQ